MRVDNQKVTSTATTHAGLSHFTLDQAARLLTARRRAEGRGVFFVQIGAMDGVSFDPIHHLVAELGWSGLLVEPLPDLFEKLRRHYADQSGMLFENCAVAERTGTVDLFRIRPEVVDRGDLPEWAHGVSSMFRDRNVLGGHKASEDDWAVIRQETVIQPVASITMNDLLEKHAIDHVDLLQIDTEGADWVVLKQVPFESMRPAVIHMEHYNLPPDERYAAIDLLLKWGYVIGSDHKDLLATRLLA